ncbi:hypothetical protein D9M69_638770 [compost metagenome]
MQAVTELSDLADNVLRKLAIVGMLDRHHARCDGNRHILYAGHAPDGGVDLRSAGCTIHALDPIAVFTNIGCHDLLLAYLDARLRPLATRAARPNCLETSNYR